MRRWIATVVLLLAGCPQADDVRVEALEEEIARLRTALGECQSSRVACEEDDRFLYSDAMRALETGDTALACGRFQTLVDRFPASPLAPMAAERIETCDQVSAELDTGTSVRAVGDEPIAIERAWLRESPFGVPLAHVRLKNVSDKTIRRFELGIQCYDPEGGVIRHLTSGQEWFVAAEVNARIPPGGFAKGGPWTMTGFLSCHRFDVVPLSVRYEDGSTWRR